MDAAALEVVLYDAALDALPPAVPAGTQITVINRAEHERHELVVFRLPDSERRSVEEFAALSPPELIAALGEPATVLLTKPGGPTIAAVGDGVLTEPGRYALMCFVPTVLSLPSYHATAFGGGPDGADEASGVVNGMHAELIVE